MKTFYVKLKPDGITRRCVLYSELPEKSLKQRISPVSKKRLDKNKEVNWGTSNIKLMFNYWNSKGWPFIRHRVQNTSVINRSIKYLRLYSKKYETRELTNAIDLGHEIFKSPTFMFHGMYRTKKIACAEFLKYKPEMLEIQNKGKRNKLPPSWMDVFLKGRKYAIEHYRRLPKEHAPYLTKRLTDIWVRYKRHNVNAEDFDFKVKMVRFSNMLFNFSKMNKLQDIWVADRIDEALNKWRTIKLPRLIFALGRNFWSETMPEELLRYHFDGFRNHKFQTNLGGLNK